MAIKKFIHILTLYEYFLSKEKPEIVINFICNNVYELIKEMKYISHVKPFDNFHSLYRSVYIDYYNNLVKNNPSSSYILFYFPNPRYSLKFSFRKFFVGVVGRRIMCYPEYLYGDPITWNIGYDIRFVDRKVRIYTCQYILLENYNEFQVEEDSNSHELHIFYRYIICKKENKYPGQPSINPEEKRFEILLSYDRYKNETDTESEMWLIDKKYNIKIAEACNKIFNNRLLEDKYNIKPLYYYKEELEKLLSE